MIIDNYPTKIQKRKNATIATLENMSTVQIAKG